MRDTFSPRGPEAGAAYPPQQPQAPVPYPPPPGLYAPPQEPQQSQTPGPYGPPPGALAVIEPPARAVVSGGPPPSNEPENPYHPDPEQQSPIWRAIKWPIRKALLGIYYAIQAARRHKVITLAVTVFLLAMLGSAIVVHQLTAPQGPRGVPTSVVHFFHGRQTGNAQEMYNSLDPTLQDSNTQTFLQQLVANDKSESLTITNYSLVDQHAGPNGATLYVFRLNLAAQGQTGTQYYTVLVGPNGLIQDFGAMYGPAA